MATFAYGVATYNGPRLVETIHSIPKGSRCLVVDNSQFDKSLAWAWNYMVDRLIYHEGYDYVIICNDDIVLQPTTGENLVKALSEKQFDGEGRVHPDKLLLLISAYNTNHVDPFTLDETCTWAPEFRDRKYTIEDLPLFKPRWGTGPDYSCFCIGRSLFDQVGRFDEEFYPAYFEDNDSHYRIQMCGYEAASYAPYFHHGSQTLSFRGENELMNRQVEERATTLQNGAFDKCRQRYNNKWGGDPGNEIWTTPFGVK